MASENVLAKNVLHCLLVSLPKEVESEEARKQLSHVIAHWIPVLSQQQVFASVSSVRVLSEFQARILSFIEANGFHRHTELSCLQLLCPFAQQCSYKVMEPFILRYLEALLNLLRSFGNDAFVYTQICILLQALFQYTQWYTSTLRREMLGNFSKLIPILITKLTEIANTATSESPSTNAQAPNPSNTAISTGIDVFKVLLQQNPTSMRSFTAKIETAISVVFHTTQYTNLDCGLCSMKCMGLLANASDNIAHSWLQITSMLIEVLHVQLDLLDGKRANATKSQQPKHWIRNSVKEHPLSGCQRANLILVRCQMAVQALLACLKNDRITEREIQQITSEIIGIVRRAVSIEVSQVGPQSMISSDGLCLPACYVHGILPGIHKVFLRVFGAFVSASGLNALRHTSAIARIFSLAFTRVHSLHRSSLYDAIATCVASLGASTISKLGPMLNLVLVHLDQELVIAQSAHARDAQVDTMIQSTKGKKRKRQQSDLVSLFDNDDIMGTPSWGSTRQRLAASSIKAAVSCVSRILLVYGGLIPIATRSKVSKLTRVLSQCDLHFDSAVEKSHWKSDITFLLLSNSISPTGSDRHMTDLSDALEFFKRNTRLPLCQMGICVGENLIHPRAPPLSIMTTLFETSHTTESIVDNDQEKLAEWKIIEPEGESDEKNEQEQEEEASWPNVTDVWTSLPSMSKVTTSPVASEKEESPKVVVPSMSAQSVEEDDFPAIVEDESDS
ncbi:unnamed protein product [Albugo candida]|uniref:Pre-rRNA-processing protein RIX1 N-terminal domain-containing protein n=1 Tax=Albugo candida TaxID=65357 RepID=A0A024FTB8_9STRA|nr:unnamed protein product [Albugo candida]|eukprot:CCI10343.1 unnamed protein product [Albugo candida]